MILIVGLGNPGEKYENTRHNLGFMVLDDLAKKLLPLEKTIWKKDNKSNSLFIINTPLFILAKPQTFMNASGSSVSKLAAYYKIKPQNIWVIHDDVDLPLGKFKIRVGGAAAGHHGVESIMAGLGTDKFVRFRLGIGRPVEDSFSVESYVLEGLEAKEARKMIKKTVKAVSMALEKGLEKTMNRFN